MTTTRTGNGVQPVGEAVGEPDSAVGSNNWVVSGTRTASGRPHVASDPHIAFEAVSCWYEVHLQGGSFDVAGCTYVGMPAVIIGRNRRMAWGITNNIARSAICTRKRRAPTHPGCFLNGEVGTGPRADRADPRPRLRPHLEADRLLAQRADRVRDFAAARQRDRPGFAQMAGRVSRRLADRTIGHEPGRRSARRSARRCDRGTCRRFRSCLPTSRGISAIRRRGEFRCEHIGNADTAPAGTRRIRGRD